MKIKETPTTYSEYYDKMRERTIPKREEVVGTLDKAKGELEELYNIVRDNTEVYKSLGVTLSTYNEYAENKYITGEFLDYARTLFINRKNNYEANAQLFHLYRYARKQKEVHDLEHDLNHYDKLLSLTKRQYSSILRTFYTEVHRQMILFGKGYVFEGNLGWICINRCHIDEAKRRIDYFATAKRKKEILEAGGRLYNEEENKWCDANGIKYDGQDWRVFLKSEYCYEIPLLNCRIKNGGKYKLSIADYRNRTLRGKSNKQLIEECGGDLEVICNLRVDLKAKLNLCLEADNGIYLNFIRNEDQKPITAFKAHWKDRQ